MQMMCDTKPFVCFKAKDLLRTALKHFSKDLSWKQGGTQSLHFFSDYLNNYLVISNRSSKGQIENILQQDINNVLGLIELKQQKVDLKSENYIF